VKCYPKINFANNFQSSYIVSASVVIQTNHSTISRPQTVITRHGETTSTSLSLRWHHHQQHRHHLLHQALQFQPALHHSQCQRGANTSVPAEPAPDTGVRHSSLVTRHSSRNTRHSSRNTRHVTLRHSFVTRAGTSPPSSQLVWHAPHMVHRHEAAGSNRPSGLKSIRNTRINLEGGMKF